MFKFFLHFNISFCIWAYCLCQWGGCHGFMLTACSYCTVGGSYIQSSGHHKQSVIQTHSNLSQSFCTIFLFLYQPWPFPHLQTDLYYIHCLHSLRMGFCILNFILLKFSCSTFCATFELLYSSIIALSSKPVFLSLLCNIKMFF